MLISLKQHEVEFLAELMHMIAMGRSIKLADIYAHSHKVVDDIHRKVSRNLD